MFVFILELFVMLLQSYFILFSVDYINEGSIWRNIVLIKTN